MATRVYVRPAVIGDADDMASISIEAWRTNLKDLVPKEFIAALKPEKQKKKYAERAADPSWLLLVAECDSKTVGVIGAAFPDIAYPSSQKEIKSLYIDPLYQRCGVGTALLHSALAELRSQDVDGVMLWCMESNAQACSFYSKHGGKQIKGVTPPSGYADVPHVIFTWDLRE